PRPGGAGTPGARGRRLRPSPARGRPDEGPRDRRDARLGRGPPEPGLSGADRRGRGRDVGRRPQVRGGHPARPWRHGAGLPRGGRRDRLTGGPTEPAMTAPRDPNDPAIVRAPWGPEVDGRRLLAESVGFGRALRAAGLATDLGAAVDFARALALVDIGDRGTVREAGQAVFVRRRDDREVYDKVFARWWRRRGRKRPPSDGPLGPAGEEEAAEGDDGAATPAGD